MNQDPHAYPAGVLQHHSLMAMLVSQQNRKQLVHDMLPQLCYTVNSRTFHCTHTLLCNTHCADTYVQSRQMCYMVCRSGCCAAVLPAGIFSIRVCHHAAVDTIAAVAGLMAVI